MADQISQKLADLILHDYDAVQTLPGERILAERYACTRTTIRAALQWLQERELLQSNPRRGHKLVRKMPESSGRARKKQWNVVLLASSVKMEDQNFLDFLGGVIHMAHQSTVNLVVREIADPGDLAGVRSLDQFHPGIVADGYILVAYSEPLASMLTNLLTPCIVLGDSSDFDHLERRRFVQVYLPQREKLLFLVERLVEFGHKKILFVAPTLATRIPEPFQFKGAQIDTVVIPVNPDSTLPQAEVADQVLAALGDHTALLIGVGGASALEIYHRLTEAGYRIPQRLSLAIDSGRYDYFVRVFDIASIYSSAREEGACCMEELLRQLSSGSVHFIMRKSHFSYRDGASIDVAMSPEKAAEFDRSHHLPVKNR